MTFSTREFYGDAEAIHFTEEAEEFDIPDYSQARVWFFTSEDVSSGDPFIVRLPDALTLRQLGWMHYLIINFTVNSIQLRSYNDVELLTTIPFADVAKVGLWQAFPAQSWVISVHDATSSQIFGPAFTVNYGSDEGSQNECETYSHFLDAWTTRTAVAVDSFAVAAADYLDGAIYKSYYCNGTTFREFAGGSHIIRATPLTESQHSPMTDGGSSTSILKWEPDALGALSTNDAERYDITGDAWNGISAFPTAYRFEHGRAVTIAPGLGARTPFILTGSPDARAGFVQYTMSTASYTIHPNLPPPSANYAATMADSGTDLHAQGGDYSENSPANANYASYFHNLYNPLLRTWSAQPRLVTPARGQGSATISNNTKRYTFGMGASRGYPFTNDEVHTQFDETTLAYTQKGIFAWGARDRRENAWTRVALF